MFDLSPSRFAKTFFFSSPPLTLIALLPIFPGSCGIVRFPSPSCSAGGPLLFFYKVVCWTRHFDPQPPKMLLSLFFLDRGSDGHPIFTRQQVLSPPSVGSLLGASPVFFFESPCVFRG